MPRIEQIAGHRFDNEAFHVAILDQPLPAVAAAAGFELTRELDDLGPLNCAVLKLPSSNVVMLYEREYDGKGISPTVCFDTALVASSNVDDLLKEFLDTLGVDSLTVTRTNTRSSEIAVENLGRRRAHRAANRQPGG